jgi:hypothetical protein
MRMIRTAALATALLLTTTLAAQAGLTDHWKRPMIDTTTTQGIGDSTSPGDPFLPNQPNGNQPPKDYAPWAATCVYGGNAEHTKFWIGFKNTGNTTIPKGTVILIDTPYGTYKVKTVVDLEPGQIHTIVYADQPFVHGDCMFDFTPSPADYPPEGPR